MAKPNSQDEASVAVADVTVVIPTFNRAAYLAETLDSMLAQTVRAARILVVDDGSTDDTGVVLQRYASRVDAVTKRNGGKSAALNLALASITTRRCWFFDDDDAAYPHALDTLLRTAEAAPNLAFAFGSFDFAKPAGTRLLDAPVRPAPYRHAAESIAQQRLHLYRDYTFAMSGSLLRTDAVRAVGGLDETLIRSQDYDLMVRLAARFEFRYCGTSIFVVREHDGPRGSAPTRHTHADRVRVWAAYGEPIGRFLRHTLPLQAFSPTPERPPTGDDRAQALLNRAWALAPKLPSGDSIDDLIEAARIDRGATLSAEQIDRVADTYHDDFVAFRSVWPLLRLCALVRSSIGTVVLRHLARGLYWLGGKQSQWFDRARFTALALTLATVARIAGVCRAGRARRA